MTNEQLAILLQGKVNKLRCIRNQLCEQLNELDGIEYERRGRYEWIGEGEPPSSGSIFAAPDSEDWKWVSSEDKDKPVLLENLDVFLELAERDVDLLRGGESD